MRLVGASAARFQLLEEVVALVVDKDESGEVFNRDFPNGLHAEFWIFHAFDALDAALRENGSHATDGAEVETAVLLAGIGHHLTAVRSFSPIIRQLTRLLLFSTW